MPMLPAFFQEVLSLVKDKKVLVSVLVLLLIPVLYSATFLWAFWDPYNKMDRLPVAVVNLDEGAVQDGKKVNLGAELVEKLRDNQSFNWRFVNLEEAQKGLEENRYYMMVQIPPDFSRDAATAVKEHPDAPKLVYMPNESFNFLAAQIGETAVRKIKEEVSKSIREEYVTLLLDGFDKMADGLKQAGRGAHELHQGTREIEAGVDSLEQHLQHAAEGSKSLKEGSEALTAAYGQIHQGIQETHKGTKQLAEGTAQLQEGTTRLLDGARKSQAGMTQLEQQLGQASQGIDQLEKSSRQLTQGMMLLAKQHPELANDPAFTALYQGSQSLHDGIQELAAAARQLAKGADQLADGQAQLADGIEQFHGHFRNLDAGVRQLLQGEEQLLQGSGKFQESLTRFKDGASELADGSSRLQQGARSLHEGMQQLAEGSGTLSKKLSEASEETSNVKNHPENRTMIADPVQMDIEKIHEVPNYGTGFTPYFLSLGLYVGALILSIILPLRDPATFPRSGSSWFFSKFLLCLLIGLLQAVIADLVLLYGLGVPVQSVPKFFFFTAITSLCFVTLIQFLVTTLDQPGRFLAILILILQLTSSAGTFPLEVIPQALQQIYAWLPMSYSVAGFKAVISSGNDALMWNNVKVLLLFTAGAGLATWMFFVYLYRRQKKRFAKHEAGELAS
ncbi:MAG: hypothetical protein BAA01_14230 [Bacillus thermozeamaize]|uniref:ABC-2 type transporter transmembrane domain-containing protein n=1 Tax=Bacillus thermozeamaize TaxID=230954 RepID=A0A1Y3PN06_9BACI|nr:MAG: hypothetical protein BAA01_14230 [Bacillus thermozeamaize]